MVAGVLSVASFVIVCMSYTVDVEQSCVFDSIGSQNEIAYDAGRVGISSKYGK